ncbi:MAG: tetratricopeptide repeat protein [Coleofasciculaceae cyanobacterium]
MSQPIYISRQQADFAKVSYGFTEGIGTPLKLMAKLYEDLPTPALPSLWKRDVRELRPAPDPFNSLYEEYRQALSALQTQPLPGKQTVDGEQQGALKDLLELGVITLFAPATTLDAAVAGLAKGVGMLRDAPQALATGKERVQQLLQQHPATKGKKELQELLLEPLPKLTQAFAQGLIEKAQKHPVVLVLDTYEKAPSNFDLWLCKSLLGNTELNSHPVCLVVAGRHNLLKTEYWRKLQQDRNLIYEQSLERFDQEKTAEYLGQISITAVDKVGDIYKATKGLPYYLDWIRQKIEEGQELDFSQGNDEIVKLLLQGLNSQQKQVLQLAACCRWFDKGLIQYLMNNQGLNFDSAADDTLNCFDWLTQRDFAEFAQHRYRLDDVARDVFRLSLWQEDKQQFYQVHGLLADYFQELAEEEVPTPVGAKHLDYIPLVSQTNYPPNASPSSAQYNNPDWREYTAEFLYHALFARRKDIQVQFISHLFASRYLGQDEVVKIPVNGIIAEADLAKHPLLKHETRQFLSKIKPAVEYGWEVLEQEKIDWEFMASCNFSKSQIEDTLRICFSQIDLLQGLAKFAALLYKSRRCPESQCGNWLQKAKAQAEQIATPADPEFSSGLFLWVGYSLYQLGQYEEALASYEKALEIKPDLHEAWYNRGVALYKLGRYEEAIASYEKALEIKPDNYAAWNNKGNALGELGRYEEAIASYERALEIKPDNYAAWNNRGNALGELGHYEEEIASYERALEIKPDDDTAWYNKGIALSELGRDEEAIASYEKALQFKPDDDAAWYNKACCYALQNQIDLGLENLQKAINLNPEENREMAKTDSDFDNIRALGQFLKYQLALEQVQPDRILYLAIPLDAYDSFFTLELPRLLIERYQVHLIVYEPTEEVIVRWKK